MTANTKYETLDKATLDNLMEGCQLIGFDWRYIYVNDAVIKQSKYAHKADLLGNTMMEKYPGIEETELFRVLKVCMEARTSETMLNEFSFPDNSKGWFELRIEPVPKGLFILSMDVTDRVRAEQAVTEYINSLEEMLSITSHKVRQPISYIMGLMNALEHLELTKEDFQRITSHLPQAVNALDNFTRELTAFIHDKKITMQSVH